MPCDLDIKYCSKHMAKVPFSPTLFTIITPNGGTFYMQCRQKVGIFSVLCISVLSFYSPEPRVRLFKASLA